MKVTMINAGYPVPPVYSGPIAHTVYETALSIRDPELTVISPWHDRLKGVEVPPGVFYHVDVYREQAEARQALGGQLPGGLYEAHTAWRFAYFKGVVSLIESIDPDVIQMHNGPYMVPGLARRFPHKRLVMYLHNNFGDVSPAVRAADRVVVVSQSMIERTVRRCPECLPKVSVIYNSVDVATWHPGVKESSEVAQVRREYALPSGQTVLFLGRLVQQKGIDHLVDAMVRVRRRLPDAKLLVVGSGVHGDRWTDPFEEKVKKAAVRLGDGVVFVRYVSHDRTPCFYGASDVTVVPSVWAEPFGKVVAESMAVGVPVIGSRRGGIPEIVEDGVSGMLIDDPANTGELAHRIEEMLTDTKKRKQMGEAARKRAGGYFSKDARMAQIGAFYRDLKQEINTVARPPLRKHRRSGQRARPMKVTLVNSPWLPVPPVQGGPVADMLHKAALAIRDPELTVISPWHERLKGVAVPPGVFYHVDVQREQAEVRQALGRQLPGDLSQTHTSRRLAYFKGVVPLLETIDPDVIEVHNSPYMLPGLARRFPRKRLVMYLHNNFGDVSPAVRAADRVVVVSQSMIARTVHRCPECLSKVSVIHNSVDVDRWHPDVKVSSEVAQIRRAYGLPEGRTVLFVGRLVREKGIDHLVDAMVRVRHTLPDAKLLIVGSAFFKDAGKSAFVKGLERRAERLGDGIVFTGFVDYDRTSYFYGASDVTVVPSVWSEPFGKVVVESMAVGAPVIGSRRGGIPEIVEDGVNGVLFDNPEDVQVLADCIVDLIRDGEKRQVLGLAARERVVQHFSDAGRIKALSSLYRDLKMGGLAFGNEKGHIG